MVNLSGLRVHIIGLGSLGTGQACARVLSELGAKVEVSDVKPKTKLAPQLAALADLPITFHLGAKAYQDISEAKLVILSPGVPLDIPPLQAAREAGALVVSEIEAAYWIAPCPIIAVTGTKGKTTTTTLIGKLLQAAGKSVLVGGNIGIPLIQLARQAKPQDLLVAEVSSFQLEATRDFRPKVAVFLNFFADHLDRHADLWAYWDAKNKLFANQTAEDFAVLNADDLGLSQLVGKLSSQVVTFSLQRPATADMGDGFFRIDGEPVCPVEGVRLRGRHNLYNVAAALATAHLLGSDLEGAEAVLKEFRGVENRLEEVAVVNGVTFINDSQATIPEAAAVALEAMEAPVVLIAGGRPKVSDFSPLGKTIAQRAAALITIGEAAEAIAAAAKGAGLKNSYRAASLEEAVEKAYALSSPGGMVLLSPACASFDMFNNMAHRGEVFRAAVRALEAKSKSGDSPLTSSGRGKV
jgi:UDP-N-acetylmuramoylalanine--D-glutamate ligase